MALDRVILLDENTANRIAAGEVIERPASAVKELVENAIDAGATQVTITLDEGGKRRIVVTDNGIAMTRSDAVLALQRHATSKIRSADDLFAIRTLGFRGEALPSIASVSNFELVTKQFDAENGVRVRVANGEIVEVADVAARDGTTVEVADLFYNTPARLKFLKSTPSEVGRTMEAVGHLAIACPRIGFRLRQQTHETLSTPGTGEPLGALAAVWGRDTARKMVPIEFESPGISVTGHVATPDLTRTGRSHELFFVNRRPIKSRLLAHALEDAYRSLTPESRYPIAAIFVEIDPELVDVNVHPTKAEVKFTRDGDVHHAVSQAVKRALLAYGVVPAPRVTAPGFDESPPLDQPGFRFAPGGTTESGGSAFEFGALIDTRPPAELAPWRDGPVTADQEPDRSSAQCGDEAGEPLSERPHPRPFAEQLREFRVIGQARNTYIIALTPDGIAVIDQHVAHERVLYERLTAKRFAGGVPVQRLVVPVSLDLGRREALLLSEHCESFSAAGWDIAPFGGESFLIRAVPAVLANKPFESILRDMIEELVSQTVSRRLLVQRDHVTITNACKMAVKAGDPLTIDEMSGLLEQLAETENPYLCPHGRPIVVKIPFGELDRQFKRA
jgi:DNA mismatch repair protein MutL